MNRNLSNYEIARKKVFRGFNGIRIRGLCVRAEVLYQLSYEDPYTGGRAIYWVHQIVKGMKHRMKWCKLREYKWNEYVTVVVNLNLSNWTLMNGIDMNRDSDGRAGVAQWWERSPPASVAWVRFPDPASYVGWVCCWFSPCSCLFFSGYSGFPLSSKTNNSGAGLKDVSYVLFLSDTLLLFQQQHIVISTIPDRYSNNSLLLFQRFPIVIPTIAYRHFNNTLLLFQQ